MVDEGFGLAGAFGDAEGVGEEFFDEEEVRGGGEGGVEGEDGAGAAEAVAGEVELGHGVYCVGQLGTPRNARVVWRVGLRGEQYGSGDASSRSGH